MTDSLMEREYEAFIQRLRQNQVTTLPATFYHKYHKLLKEPDRAEEFLRALSINESLETFFIDCAVITARVILPSSVKDVTCKWATSEVLGDILQQVKRLNVSSVSVVQQQQYANFDENFTDLLSQGAVERLTVQFTGYCYSSRAKSTNFDALAEGIAENTTLQHFDLNVPKLDSESFERLCDALSSSQVSSLVAPPINSMNEACALRKLLAKSQSLRSLKLSASRKPVDGSSSQDTIVQIFRGLSEGSCSIEELHLYGCVLSEEAWKLLGLSSTLSSLDLEKCALTSLDHLQLLGSLKHLRVHHNPSIQHSLKLCGLTRNLISLSLQDVQLSTLSCVESLAMLLTDSQLASLSIGCLRLDLMTDTECDSAYALISEALACTSIPKLALGQYGRSGQDVKRLFECVSSNKRITCLSLNACAFESTQCSSSLHQLISTGSLQELDLSNAPLGFTNEAINSIADGLDSSKLVVLRLNGIAPAESSIWEPLYQSLARSHSLHSLELCFYGSRQGHDKHGWNALVETLPRWQKLQRFSITESLNSRESTQLINALRCNYVIQYVDKLEMRNSREQSKLDFYLELNRRGRRLLSDPLASPSLLAIAFARKNYQHLGLRYYSLREGHFLLEQ